MGVYVMDSIRFNKLARIGDVRTTRIVWPHPFLPCAVKAMVPPQDAAHTAEADRQTIDSGNIVPDDLSTAFECVP
jgi:hypothetical protein